MAWSRDEQLQGYDQDPEVHVHPEAREEGLLQYRIGEGQF